MAALGTRPALSKPPTLGANCSRGIHWACYVVRCTCGCHKKEPK